MRLAFSKLTETKLSSGPWRIISTELSNQYYKWTLLGPVHDRPKYMLMKRNNYIAGERTFVHLDQLHPVPNYGK